MRYMRKTDEWKVWAGKITGMILESNGWDLKDVLKDEKKLQATIKHAKKILT